MSKKVDWNSSYKPFGTQSAPGSRQPKYKNLQEKMAKAYEDMAVMEAQQSNLSKALPLMEALLKCKLEDQTPITVMRPLVYQSSEYDGGEHGGRFHDVQKVIRPGTNIVLKSLDPVMQEFIFEDDRGNEYALPYIAKMQLMTNTNIYESAVSFINQKGE